MATADLAKPKTAAAKPAAAKKPPAVKAAKPFASVNDIKMGMTVRDPASGLTGIATMKTEMISGTVQYAIQPVGDGKSIPEGHFVDDFMLEFVDDGVSKKAPTPDSDAKFRIGQELRDTLTGFKGIAVERTTYLNGCVHYSLQPSVKKQTFLGGLLGEAPRASHFDFKRLTLVGDGVADKLKKPTKVDPKPAEPPVHKRSATGGPTRSIRSTGL